jgi:DNA-binding MarR family transcriptional regulator
VSTKLSTKTELKPRELRAWRAFLDAQAAVLRKLEAELTAEARMTLAEYDVLYQLRAAPSHELRMSDLSERVRLSRSGITRLVDRLAADGLVERADCPSDRRGTLARLTDKGLARVEEAIPTHLRGIRDHFATQLSPDQLDSLAAALEPLGHPVA